MGRLMFNGRCYSGGKFLISPECYSTEERELGCWTDGKPLYQKTVHTGALATGDISVAHNVSNLGTVVSAKGMFSWINKQSPFAMASRNSTTWNATIADIQSDNITFEVGSSYTGTYAITDSYVTLTYTKSTDTAGSGTWTPQGVPAVHYSTNEQVVGTWIDGRTLYECTYHFENMGTSTHHYLYEYPGETGWVKNALVQRRQGNEWHSAPLLYWDGQLFISVHCYPYIIEIDIGPSSEYANEAYVTVCYVKPAS